MCENSSRLKNLQLSDGRARDAFEKVVELYYQCNGYMTSNNKWFKINKKNYTDIDLVAINGHELRIVNISTNLSDKSAGELKTHFKESCKYVAEQYKSFFEGREKAIKTVNVIAYINDSEKRKEEIDKEFRKEKPLKKEYLPASHIFETFAKEFERYINYTNCKTIRFKSGFKLEDEVLQVMQWCYAFFVKKEK